MDASCAAPLFIPADTPPISSINWSDETRPDNIVHLISSRYSPIFNIAAKRLSYFSSKPVGKAINPVKSIRLATSCIINVLALSVIFSGPQKTQGIMPKLMVSFKDDFQVSTPNGPVMLNVDNLFTGAVLNRLDRHFFTSKYDYDSLLSALNQHLDDVAKPFYAVLEKAFSDLVVDEKKHQKQLLGILKGIDYDFNAETFECFLRDIAENETNQVNSGVSHLFYVVIQIPKPANRSGTIYHAFAIEKFWDSHTQKPAYRLYQSWLCKMTTAMDMEKRGYDKTKPWQWSRGEFDLFLQNLKLCICKSARKHDEIFKAHLQAFGYAPEDDFNYHHSFNSDAMTFEGLSFRYFKDILNPRDIPANIKSFVSSL